MKSGLALSIVILAGSTHMVFAGPVEDAEADYRNGMVHIIEQVLFKETKKTTSVIYAKTWGASLELICGEALFGSHRGAFFINAQGGGKAGASKTDLRKAGCNAEGGEVLIDLR